MYGEASIQCQNFTTVTSGYQPDDNPGIYFCHDKEGLGEKQDKNGSTQSMVPPNIMFDKLSMSPVVKYIEEDGSLKANGNQVKFIKSMNQNKVTIVKL
eukprot:403357113